MINQYGAESGEEARFGNLSETLREALSTGWLAVSGSRRVVALNPTAERILGHKASFYLHQSLDRLPAPLPEIVREILAAGKTMVNCEVCLKNVGRPDRPVMLDAATFSLMSGGQEGVAMTLRDLGAARHLEEQMRRLDRLAGLGTLFASVSHEVKNALVPMKTFIQLLAEKYPEAELGALARQELGRVEEMLAQLLKFSTRGTARYVPIGLHTVLDRCAKIMNPQMNLRRIRPDWRLMAPRDQVLGDANQLEQAFINVLLNALEAMQDGGCLTVETLRQGDAASGAPQIVVTVGDTGSGIEPEHMKRLFETFFTTKPQGTGLGLAITRRILREHHGEIDLESCLDQGTTVRIYLPLLNE